jgi:hypothetical protein
MLFRSAFHCLALISLLTASATVAEAQFDRLRKHLPGAGNRSEVEAVLNQIDSARIKSAYARLSLSLADDIIRRQALRNTAKKSARGQIERDEQELKELDRSIAEKRKLLAELGRKSGGGEYDDKTAKQVEQQLTADEQRREEKRAMVDEEIADRERNEKELSRQDRENYGKLARILYGASKQEQAAIETAQEVKPRAQAAATNTQRSPLGLAATQPKRLNEGLKAMSELLAEGPQHVATLTTVANHLAKIGGVDLTDPKFEAKVVTDEDEIPTDW